MKIPQIGRVIIQDRVEIGACTTIDRGALGDTVLGEGTKIDNLVQLAHNAHLGRHNIVVAQAGIAGSCEFGDFVIIGTSAGRDRRSRKDRRCRPGRGTRGVTAGHHMARRRGLRRIADEAGAQRILKSTH